MIMFVCARMEFARRFIRSNRCGNNCCGFWHFSFDHLSFFGPVRTASVFWRMRKMVIPYCSINFCVGFTRTFRTGNRTNNNGRMNGCWWWPNNVMDKANKQKNNTPNFEANILEITRAEWMNEWNHWNGLATQFIFGTICSTKIISFQIPFQQSWFSTNNGKRRRRNNKPNCRDCKMCEQWMMNGLMDAHILFLLHAHWTTPEILRENWKKTNIVFVDWMAEKAKFGWKWMNWTQSEKKCHCWLVPVCKISFFLSIIYAFFGIWLKTTTINFCLEHSFSAN